MGYTMSIEERTDFLHVKVAGENSSETLQAYLAGVYKACTERGFSSVLIEENLSGPSLSPTDIYHVISKASSQTSPVLKRIAYVDTNADHPQSILALGEAVARDRGVNIRVFNDTIEAARWLADA